MGDAVAQQVAPAAHGRPCLAYVEGVIDDQRGGADLVEPELELGDDPEVSSAAAQPPEQVLVLRFTDTQRRTLRGDDLVRDDVVAR